MSRALSAAVRSRPNDRRCKKEAKVLRLLDTLRSFVDLLKDLDFTLHEDQAREDVRRVLEHGCKPLGVRADHAHVPHTFVVICGEQ